MENNQQPVPGTSDAAQAAQELLENGILVETSKGLVCMSLKDALNHGVGGRTLSEEDFQNVAAKLLFQEEPEKRVIPLSHLETGVDSLLVHVKPTRTVVQGRNTLLKRNINKTKCLTFDNNLPSSSKGYEVRPIEFSSADVDSVLVSDSGLSSDTSEIASVSNDSANIQVAKKRGGWPKGRKRKPESKCDTRPPKAPTTGYVIFLNERRKDYRDLPFTEVTKLLGNEWSRLSLHDKKKYLDQAEIDKKRYREELRVYRQSDAYREYLNRKRQKRLQGHGTEESDMDATDEIDEEDSEELYCRLCDQWFHSLHNKKEHLYGRQHLSKITGQSKEEWPACPSWDESSLDGSREDNIERKASSSLDMDDAILRVIARNMEREREVEFLRQKNAESQIKKESLLKTMADLKIRLDSTSEAYHVEEQLHLKVGLQIRNIIKISSLFPKTSN